MCSTNKEKISSTTVHLLYNLASNPKRQPIKVWNNKQCFHVRKWKTGLFHSEQCQQYMGLFASHRVMWVSLWHWNCISPWELCVDIWVEWRTFVPPKRQGILGQGSNPACNFDLPLATNFISQQSGRLWNSVATWLKGYLIWEHAVTKVRGISNWLSQHCLVAMAFKAQDKLIWEEKTPVHAIAGTLEMIFLVHFFLHAHIHSTGLPPAGTRRIFCGLTFFFQGSYIIYLHQCLMKNNVKWFIFTFSHLNFCTWPVLNIYQGSVTKT